MEENKNRIVLGYDLNDTLSQVSYAKADEKTPSTLATIIGSDKYTIPTVLAKKKGVNQWFFGEEALKAEQEGEGILVRNLLSLAKAGEPVTVDEEEFSPVMLLILFLKRTLALVNILSPWQLSDFIMITVEKLDGRMIEVMKEVSNGLPIDASKIRLQSYVESFYYYTIHQPDELWKYQVIVFDYSENGMKSYRLEMNRRTSPVVVFIEEKEYTELREKSDEDMLAVSEEILKNRIVSSVYLIGKGFEGEWATETLKLLCNKRRVFQGKNLYTKGACYAALEKMYPGELETNYVFLGNDKLKCNIGMKLIRNGAEIYQPLADAGINWYDVSAEKELLLGKEKEIRLMLTPLTGLNARYAVIRLYELPDRPERCSRVRIKISMKTEDILNVKIFDLGFGELFPSTGRIWQEEVRLYEDGLQEKSALEMEQSL